MPTETERLNTLQLYNMLDTASEKAFDDLTLLASSICGTPISLVSFIDKDRQWFKSKLGLKVNETPREQAFCDHAIRSDNILVVEDAQADKRFSNNPLITGDPNIRFYAGAPLQVGNGAALGTLCVIDHQPRSMSKEQLSALSVLRDAVVAQLELRRALQDMQAINQIIPICAWCRSVKVESSENADTHWQQLHEYVADNNKVSHGIYPTCSLTI